MDMVAHTRRFFNLPDPIVELEWTDHLKALAAATNELRHRLAEVRAPNEREMDFNEALNYASAVTNAYRLEVKTGASHEFALEEAALALTRQLVRVRCDVLDQGIAHSVAQLTVGKYVAAGGLR